MAKDVCAEGVLGLGNVTQAVKFLDDDEKKTLPYPAFVQVNGGSLNSSDPLHGKPITGSRS